MHNILTATSLIAVIAVVSSAPQDIGINFLGFKVGAGLNGGPHAFAETPYGPKAAAGVGGPNRVGNGGVYAGAEVNEGLGAAAGVGSHPTLGVTKVTKVVSPVAYEKTVVPSYVRARPAVVTTQQVTKPVRPGLYDDIFNIPIQTLQAVNQLLNG